MKAGPSRLEAWAAGFLDSVPPANLQDSEQEVFPTPGPQFPLSEKPSQLSRSSKRMRGRFKEGSGPRWGLFLHFSYCHLGGGRLPAGGC